MNRVHRRNELRGRASSKRVDAFLFFDPSDNFYLNGFPQEGCFTLVSRDGDFIFSPPMLAEQARIFTKENRMEIVVGRKLLRSLATLLRKNRLRRIGYDPSKTTVALFKEMQALCSVTWVPLDGFLMEQRTVKDKDEIELISRACRITGESAEAGFEMLREGRSEEEIAYYVESLFHKKGSPMAAFQTIVAFGGHSAYPHHVVTGKRLEKNSAVLMDLGSVAGGYCSDLTRTGFFGNIPKLFSKIYRIVKRSQQEGISAVRDGVPVRKVDFSCRKVIARAGYEDCFTHGTGHGVGLDIHEPPRIRADSKGVLRAGMVVTIEPGIYLPGQFGVRIEDTLLVTKTGCRVLTR